MEEYLEMRCCMCPNLEKKPHSRVCPPSPLGEGETPCRFVKSYADADGNLYTVVLRKRLGFRAVRLEPNKPNQRGKAIANLNISSFENAQSGLNMYAKHKKLTAVRLEVGKTETSDGSFFAVEGWINNVNRR